MILQWPVTGQRAVIYWCDIVRRVVTVIDQPLVTVSLKLKNGVCVSGWGWELGA